MEGDVLEPFTPEIDAERFGESAARNLPICSSYGLGLEASIVHQLKTNWVKVNSLFKLINNSGGSWRPPNDYDQKYNYLFYN